MKHRLFSNFTFSSKRYRCLKLLTASLCSLLVSFILSLNTNLPDNLFFSIILLALFSKRKQFSIIFPRVNFYFHTIHVLYIYNPFSWLCKIFFIIRSEKLSQTIYLTCSLFPANSNLQTMFATSSACHLHYLTYLVNNHSSLLSLVIWNTWYNSLLVFLIPYPVHLTLQVNLFVTFFFVRLLHTLFYFRILSCRSCAAIRPAGAVVLLPLCIS